jgi:predicted dienelactone hydrolase
MVALATFAGAQSAVQFRLERVPDGPKVAVWYPDATGNGERLPLILFSHGLDSCGTQSVFLTDQVARAGYVVAAPDHRDASCSVDGPRLPHFHLPRLRFTNPEHWDETSYADRRADLEKTLDWMLAGSPLSQRIDPARIGAVGHSLGGYSVLGWAGGWDSWRDARVTAVVALSPYVRPFMVHHRMAEIRVPVMYQGAQFDLGITPALRGPRGAFAETGGPAYYVELERGSHFEWTNGVCWGHRAPAECLAKRSNPRLIVEYTVAFLDRYLKRQDDHLNGLTGRGLRAYLTPLSKMVGWQ